MISQHLLYKQRPAILLSILIVVWASIFILRWTAPSDLLDKDQERPAAYMADAALNGHWIVQVDDKGQVCSKPPVYTWIGAGLILATGRINTFALYFPSALAVLGCCLLMYFMGRRPMGLQAAFLGGIFLILSPIGLRIIYLARTDAMFSFATFLAACVGYGCWRKGWSWVWFWLAATIATLTKGPLGLVLALGGFIGLLGQKRHRRLKGNSWLHHVFGLSLLLILGLGWLWLAYLQLGDAVLEKIIGIELYGHANWSSGKYSPGMAFLVMPMFYFISRFFPWSLLAVAGLWKVWRKPAQNAESLCFERYLAAYLCFGIALLTVFPHQRPDHLFPLLPAAGLLAGRFAIQWFEVRHQMRFFLPATIGVWIVMLVWYSAYYFKIDPNTNPWFERTEQVQKMAEHYSEFSSDTQSLYFVDTPYGLQFYLNSMKQRITYRAAAKLLLNEQDAQVAVQHPDQLRRFLPKGFEVEEILRWPQNGRGSYFILRQRKA